MLDPDLAMSRGRVGDGPFLGLVLRNKEIFLRRAQKNSPCVSLARTKTRPSLKPITAKGDGIAMMDLLSI